jgi:HSP20 family protein
MEDVAMLTTRVWNPFLELDALRREVERAFEDYNVADSPRWRSAFLPGVSARTYPMLNASEDKDNVYVEALAPGLDPSSIEVSVLRDTLRIAGQKTPICADIKPEAYHRNERGAGRFVRTLTLPTEIDGDKVKAEYKNGLLLLTLPKHERAKPKQIAVSVN